MKKFELIDKDGNKFIIVIEIKLNNAKRNYLSITGENRDCGGQIYDRIFPVNKIQKAFINFWKRWHLNDLRAGCIHQREKNKAYEISEICPVCGYRYGSKWIYEELPPQIEKAIEFFENNINNGELK